MIKHGNFGLILLFLMDIMVKFYKFYFLLYFFLIFIFLGIDTAKNAANLLHKYLIDALNQTNNHSNDQINHSSQIDLKQLTHSFKNAFLQLDKTLAGLVNDQSGSVCVNLFIYLLYK